jgi:glycosyltransferase involved in cell wall biosynthesis
VRILIFHGYLLHGGTGSNIYNAALARTLNALGHEVDLLCQDHAAASFPFVDAVGQWVDGELRVEVVREPVRCTVYLPPIGRLLPVYVVDPYDRFEARHFADLSDAELDRYLAANVDAVRAVAERTRPDVALANHLLAGPPIVARALAGSVPYAVKIHGSALEYVVRPHADRFLPLAREGLDAAGGVLVGSRHTAESLWQTIGDPGLPARTRLGPPGVDVHAFRPRAPADAGEALRALAARLRGEAAAWGGEHGAAEALAALDPERHEIVAYVGKTIVSKGVDLLLAAWPLVAARAPEARLCIVGFGTYRDALGRLAAALGRGDLDEAREIAARGRELEGGPAGELTYLASFLDRLRGDERTSYVRAAVDAMPRVTFTGRLEHSDLPALLPACAAQVVPSTFPESFGMVAVEAAACGTLPVSAAHSGLREVTRMFEPAVEADVRPLLSFEPGPGAIRDIADRLTRWLELPPARREAARAALAALARERYGWERVAEGVIAAAQGRLSELPEPPA